MTGERTIKVSTLSTEAGVTEAGAQMAEAVCQDLLWPVVQHTPKEWRGALFERFLSALTGAVVAEVGPERAKQALDAAKLAVDDLQAERSRSRAH